MFNKNLYKIEQTVGNIDEYFTEIIVVGVDKSISIECNTRNAENIVPMDVAEAEDFLEIDLNKEIDLDINRISPEEFELKITNKKETKIMLKQGEINAILNNLVKDAQGNVRVGKNSIFLNKTDDILLRTNGIVVYGEYIVDATRRIAFTFNPSKYTQPYIGSGIQNIDGKRSFFKVNYAEYKETILTAFRLAFNEEANSRLQEMRKVITQAMQNKNTQPQETKIEEKKEEVKEMNKELNVMGLAHKIRRELGLEGHYYAQLKMAMSYAWAIKRGELTLDELLNNTTEPVVADTYNTTTVAEQEIAPTQDDNVEPVLPAGQVVYLKSFVNGLATFNRLVEGKDVVFGQFKARNLRDVDKQFATNLPSLINVAPEGTIIKSYGDYTSLTFTNTPGLKALADSKGIKVEAGVAPSGIAV